MVLLWMILQLQQCLPLAVLKLISIRRMYETIYEYNVATVLTACGIETLLKIYFLFDPRKVATVLTACGIETVRSETTTSPSFNRPVATVLTACGIET